MGDGMDELSEPGTGGTAQTDPDAVVTTVVVAITDARLRQGIVDRIADAGDLELVGVSETGRDTLELIASAVPGVAVIDLQLQEPDGLEVCTHVAESFPAVRVLLTASADDRRSSEGVLAGARGYVPAAELAARVVDVVRRIARGEAVAPQDWAAHLLAEIDHLEAGSRGPVPNPVLTPGEIEVLTQFAGGLRAEEVAAQLGVPVRLVNLRVAAAIGKLSRYHRDRRGIDAT